MEGSIHTYDLPPGIRRESDGRFTIDFTKVISKKRTHVRSKGYLSLGEAIEAKKTLLELKENEAKEKEERQMPLREFLVRFEEYRLLHVRHSSVCFGRSVFHHYLNDHLEETVVEAFSPSSIHSIYQSILDSHSCPSWKNRAFGCFRLALTAAFKWRYLAPESYQNAIAILENIPENRGAKNEKKIWSKAETERFLSVIDDPMDQVIFELFVSLGARIGEFAGLTWDAVHLKSGYIEIKQQLVYNGKGKWVLSNDLKTRESYRLCKIPNRIVEMLKTYKETTSGEGFLFRSNEDPNYPMSKATFRRKFYRYITLAKVPKITPHAIRHRKATDLMRVCRNMQEVKAAARYLGHSATMMIDTYGHSEIAATDAVLRRLEKEKSF